jgi:hypothetical protein
MWTQLALLSVLIGASIHDAPLCTPSVSATVDRALRVAGLDEPLDAARRARLSRLLPTSIRVEFRAAEDDLFRDSFDVDQDFDEVLGSDGVDLSDTQQTGLDHVREARLVAYWELDALVWSSETLAALRYEDHRRAQAWGLTEEIVDLYFDLESLRREPDGSSRTLAERALTLLDERTGGWFLRESRCPENRSWPP